MSTTDKKKNIMHRFSSLLVVIAILLFLIAFYALGSNILAARPWYVKGAVFVAALVLSVVSLMMTKHWRPMIELAKGARIEARKVVWPTKNEWLKMTWLVIIVVAVFSIFLMMVDGLLGYIIDLILSN